MLLYYINEKLQAGSSAIGKGIAWCLFIVTVVASIALLLDYAVLETAGANGTRTHINVQLIAAVAISILFTGFLLAVSYLLSHIKDQLQLYREEQVTEKK